MKTNNNLLSTFCCEITISITLLINKYYIVKKLTMQLVQQKKRKEKKEEETNHAFSCKAASAQFEVEAKILNEPFYI